MAAPALKKILLRRIAVYSLNGGKHCKYCSSNTAGYNVEDVEDSSNASRDLIRLKPDLERRYKKEIPYDFLSTAKNEEIPTKTLEIKQGPDFNQNNFDRRAYAQFGARSGLKPNKFWPSAKDIELEYAKHEFFKPVAERIEDLRAKKKQEHDELMAHQRLIGERMAQMPEFIAKYEVKKEKRSEKNTEALIKRDELLEEAREFFGYEIDYRDAKFQRMVEWKEEQAKKAKKAFKKNQKNNLLALSVAKITAESQGETPS